MTSAMSYGFTTYNKAPLMLSALGGVVGDSAVQRAHAEPLLAQRFEFWQLREQLRADRDDRPETGR